MKAIITGITHCGDFHADDVFATILLLKIFPEIEISRVPHAPENVDENTIVFDIGGGQFDHHMKEELQQKRHDGMPFAAFGLLWYAFGHALCVDETAFEQFDKEFVYPVDACDNGKQTSTLSAAVGSMNPNWDDLPSDATPEEIKAHENKCFWDAVRVFTPVFDAKLKRVNSARRAVDIVMNTPAVDNGRVVVFDMFVPWQNTICQRPDVLYVMNPSNRGGWFIQRTPDEPGSFGGIASFPVEWRGYRVENEGKDGNPILSDEDSSLGLTFCHAAGFCASAKDKEAALAVTHTALVKQFGK